MAGNRQSQVPIRHTIHCTNETVFQNHRTPAEIPSDEPQEEYAALNLATFDSTPQEYGGYKIQKKKEPPLVPNYEDCKDRDLLDWCMKRDIAWVVVSAIGDQVVSQDNIPLFGSWTAFMKAVTKSETQKSLMNFMEVVPLPPTDTVCKRYLHGSVD